MLSKGVSTENIYMLRVDPYLMSDDSLLEVMHHGAFKSFRSASAFAVEEGFEAFFNDKLSEYREEETISFIKVDEKNGEIHLADIESYLIHD